MKSPWMISLLIVFVAVITFAAGAWVGMTGRALIPVVSRNKMTTLTIEWQRLVGDTGQTCDRCGTTQREVRKARALLRESLSPLGINVILEEKTLRRSGAAKNIAESNRIWIAGKPLETWLGATSGASDCASCGTLCESPASTSVQCRTVLVDGRVYEAIPSDLIVRAALRAAAETFGAEAEQPCCPGATRCTPK